MRRCWILFTTLGFSLSLSAQEAFFAQPKIISLLDKHNRKLSIGEITFSISENQPYRYQLTLDYEKFSDFFLSMKEMKCIAGTELWCHIPYPYSNPRQLSSKDLRWLEHDLLFMFKHGGSFGANLRNGIYYKLQWDKQKLMGEAHYVDLKPLGVPPEDQTAPPLGEDVLEPVEDNIQRFPHLLIE